MEQQPTLIELKAAAYDAARQIQAWQEKLNAYNAAINNYKEPDPKVRDINKK